MCASAATLDKEHAMALQVGMEHKGAPVWLQHNPRGVLPQAEPAQRQLHIPIDSGLQLCCSHATLAATVHCGRCRSKE